MEILKEFDIASYITPKIFEKFILKNIYDSQKIQISNENNNLKDLMDNLVISTATWALDIWEFELGLMTNLNDSYEIRRTRIISQLKGQGTCTIALIKNVCKSFECGEVEVIEFYEDYYFIIKFISTKGIPPNLKDLKDAINIIKPAHLGVKYEFTYNLWNYAKDFKWGELKRYKWGELLNNDLEHNFEYINLYYKDENEYKLLTFE